MAGSRYSAAIGDLNAYIAQSPKKSDTAYYFRGLAYNRTQSYRLALDDLHWADGTSLALLQQYTGWGTGQVVYVGHFGLPALSLMLYDPQQARSTFLAFNSALGLFAQASQPSSAQPSVIQPPSSGRRSSFLVWLSSMNWSAVAPSED